MEGSKPIGVVSLHTTVVSFSTDIELIPTPLNCQLLLIMIYCLNFTGAAISTSAIDCSGTIATKESLSTT